MTEIYRAHCSAGKLADFMQSRGWDKEDLASWLGVPVADLVEWFEADKIPGPVARLVQIEDAVGQYLNRSTDDREDLIWGSYFDAKGALALEYCWPATAGDVAEEPDDTEG